MNTSTQYKINFEELYISHYARMKRFAQEYVIREEDAENIVHDIFVEVLEKNIDLTSIVNLSGYLFMTLKNRCIDFLRRKTVEQNFASEMVKEYNLNLKLKLASLETLDSNLLTDENIDTILQNAIDSLPEKCRIIFIMNKLEGKKQRIIANELNISIHTVESQMSIAYKKLKLALKDHFSLFIFLFI